MTIQEKFVTDNYDAAIQAQLNFQVPYPVTLAISALKTKWGKKLYNNNFFQVKINKTEYKTYENVYDSFSDNARLIKKRFPIALRYKKDCDEFIRSMQRDHEQRYSDEDNFVKKMIVVMALIKQLVQELKLNNNKETK